MIPDLKDLASIESLRKGPVKTPCDSTSFRTNGIVAIPCKDSIPPIPSIYVCRTHLLSLLHGFQDLKMITILGATTLNVNLLWHTLLPFQYVVHINHHYCFLPVFYVFCNSHLKGDNLRKIMSLCPVI